MSRKIKEEKVRIEVASVWVSFVCKKAVDEVGMDSEKWVTGSFGYRMAADGQVCRWLHKLLHCLESRRVAAPGLEDTYPHYT